MHESFPVRTNIIRHTQKNMFKNAPFYLAQYNYPETSFKMSQSFLECQNLFCTFTGEGFIE